MGFRKWLKCSLLFFSSIFLIFLLLAPTLISTRLGNRLSLSLINNFSSFSIDLDSLSLGWASGIEVKQVVVKDDQDQILFACKECCIDRPLYKLLWTPSNLGFVRILSPTVYIREPHRPAFENSKRRKGHKGRGKTREQYPAVIEKETTDWTYPTGKVEVIDGRLIALRGETVVQELSGLNVTLELDHNRSLGSLEVTSLRRGTLSFSLHGKPSLERLKGSVRLGFEKIKTDILEIFLDQFFPEIAHIPKECFGSWLTCSLETTFNSGVISSSCVVSSDNMHSNFSCELQDNILTLNEGKWLTGKISPALFASLPLQDILPCTLLNSTGFVVENGVPCTLDTRSWQFLSPVDLKCNIDPFSFLFTKSKKSVDFSLFGSVFGQGEAAKGRIFLKTLSQKESGTAEVVVRTEKQETGRVITGDLQIKGDWPLIAEKIVEKPFSRFFGPKLSASATLTGNYSEFSGSSIQGQFEISSKKVNHSTHFSWTGKEILIKKSSLDCEISHTALPNKAVEDLGLHATALDVVLPPEIFYNKERYIDLSGSLSATIDLPRLSLGNKIASLEKGSAIFEVEKKQGTSFCNLLIRSTLLPSLHTAPLLALFGREEMKLLLGGRYDLLSREVEIDRFDLVSKHLFVNIRDVNINTRLKECTIQTPSRLSVRADKDLLSFLLPPSSPLFLQAPAEFTSIVPPCSFSYKDGIWSNFKLAMEIACEKIQFTNKELQQTFRVRIPVVIDLNAHELTCSPVIIDAITQQAFVKGVFSIKIPEQLQDLYSYTAHGNAKISQLSLSLLDPLFPLPPSDFFGETLSAKIDFSFIGFESKKNFLRVALTSPSASFDCDVVLDKMILKGARARPLSFTASLSPSLSSRLLSWLTIPSTTLSKSVDIRGSIDRLEIDCSKLTQKSSIWHFLESAFFSAKLSTSAIHIEEMETIPECKALIDLKGPDHFIGFSLDLPPQIRVQGNLENSWNSSGISLPDSVLNLTAKLKKTPTTLLTALFPDRKEALDAVIGPNIEINVEASIEKMTSGFINAEIPFSNGEVHFQSTIKDGVLSLNSPATAKLQVERKAGKELLRDSWFASALRSREPIQVRIDPEGVAIPLLPFSLSKTAIPKITVDPGKLVVKNRGALKIVLSLLNMKNASRSDKIELWFTPIYMGLKDGIITCQRSDALIADKLHIISWGTINLNEDRTEMVTAVPQETLKELKLPIVLLNPDHGLQIPITGSALNPSVDTARLSTRLAASKIRDKRKSNPFNIIGGALQVAASLGEESQPVPEPTTQPFPWEKGR